MTHAPATASDRPRPLWRTGLAFLAAQAIIAAIPAMILRDALLAHLYEGSFKEIGWAYASPMPMTLAWFGSLVIAFGWALLCLLPGTLIFLAIISRLERREQVEGLAWAVAGAVSAIPLAVGLCAIVAGAAHFPMDAWPYVIAATTALVTGFCGGMLARRVRHPAMGWSDPL